jgi:hypothetical protein
MKLTASSGRDSDPPRTSHAYRLMSHCRLNASCRQPIATSASSPTAVASFRVSTAGAHAEVDPSRIERSVHRSSKVEFLWQDAARTWEELDMSYTELRGQRLQPQARPYGVVALRLAHEAKQFESIFPDIPRLVLSRRSFCITMFLLAFAVAPARGQENTYADWAPSQADLVPVAKALAAAGSKIAGIWSGFWHEEQEALLLSPGGGMILIAASPPPADFEFMDSVGSLQVYQRGGSLPGLRSGTFPGEYEISDRRVYALPAMGTTFSERLEFYVHEAFHYYQRRTWTEVPEDSIYGTDPRRYLQDPSIVDDPGFRSQLAEEDRLLRLVAAETEPESLKALLRTYLAARQERLRERSDIEALERRFERREGTAEYVGCRAAEAALAASPLELLECLNSNFTRQQPRSLVLRMMQLRPYASGALLSLALDRLEIEGWQDAVARGMHLDQVLAHALASDH